MSNTSTTCATSTTTVPLPPAPSSNGQFDVTEHTYLYYMLKLSRWHRASVFKPALLKYRTRAVTAPFHTSARIHATVLRDYQEDAIASVLNALSSGEHRLGLSLATGSGKTVILSHLIDRIHHARAKQTLVLAHRKELVEQAAAHCHDAYPSRSVEIDMGKLQASGQADITVASVQSITNRLSNYDPTQFKLVVVDEAHHITAPSYAAILRWFGLDSKGECDIALVGLSATFSRPDGISLGTAIDHIVYHKSVSQSLSGPGDADISTGITSQ